MVADVFGWLGRKAVLYVLLVLAIGCATLLAPWLKQVLAGTTPTQLRAQILDEANRAIAAERDRTTQTFKIETASLRTASLETLARRAANLESERMRLLGALASAKPSWLLALSDRQALLTNERQRLRVAWIDQELPVIAAAREAVASRGASLAAAADLSAQQEAVDRATSLCKAAREALQTYEVRWRWRLRSWWDSDERKALVATRDQRCAAAQVAIKQRDRLSTVMKARSEAAQVAEAAFDRAANATDILSQAGQTLAADAQRARIELSGSLPQKLRLWSQRIGLAALLRAAAVALALIIASPFLIRLFCYFILAPLAMRRPSVRLNLPDGTSGDIAPVSKSRTSVQVRLEIGEELLVRQDFLQTSSHRGAKSTQWFLDWRKPLTSLTSGLTFLTRIRGDGEETTVSAVRDGLAEVTILPLPAGSTCVLQPRAVAAVAQPIGQPLRITSHWRLGSLNAWLTLQLRYLVFHGPARLVLKGGRGVRVERAEHGRIFGQDQLVGFSADLAYSVTRTETFWPYFLGREQLLKDRVLEGGGILVIEEAPYSSRFGRTRRGIEGMVDAGMKIFGM